MNNHHNIKRRRPYYREDSPSAESVLQEARRASPFQLDTASLSAQHRYIIERAASTPVRLSIPLSALLGLSHPDNQLYVLQQAASELDLPLPVLLQLARRKHHLHKRPRFNSDAPIPPSYDNTSPESRDKSPVSVQPEGLPNTGRASLSELSEHEMPPAGWTSSRLADCFATFSVCPPCSSYDPPAGYQSLPATTTYEYGGSRPLPAHPPSSLGVTGHAPLAPTTISPGEEGLFACDDPAMLQEYLPNYPPMQPTQPSTSNEAMYYPGGSPEHQSFSNHDAPRPVTGLGIQGSPTFNAADSRAEPMGDMYVDQGSQAFHHHAPTLGVSARYGMVQGYAVNGSFVKDDPEGLNQPPGSGSVKLDIFSLPRTPTARRGPFKDHDKREKTARTRKIGSCIRCRMQRIRCELDPDDEEGPCLTCRKIANTKIWRLSCLRWKITDIRLFKPGQVKGHEWTSRWRESSVVDDIGSWADMSSKTIRVTEGYTGNFVELRVRRFLPQPGDRLDRSWVSKGIKKSVKIPPYAIVDMEAAKSSFDVYIKQGVVETCQRLLGPKEKLLWQTYATALALLRSSSLEETEKNLLSTTMDLWMSIRLTTKSFEIVGDETLGMSRGIISDKENPLYGKVPLPPVMGAQIDSVLIHQVQPTLRRKTLEQLQMMTQEKRTRTWLTTYLVTFILLHNIALITKHDAEYARKHGMKRQFAREDKVKEYNIGANTLLAYFHYCNKGIYPFSEECKDQDLQTLALLSDSAIQFVRYTRHFAAEHMKQWEDLWDSNEYENEYYYVSQLFEPNWQPRMMA